MKRDFSCFARRLIIAGLALLSECVYACPDGYYESCVLGACVCLPNSGTVLKPVREGLTQAAAPALQQWIQQSRNTAVGTSSAIPPTIAAQLSPYYSRDILSTARFKVGDNGVINAARSIMGANGDVAAVTLIDVIVFRGPSEAQSLPLWAHEMKHIQQYREWGVRDFAIRYTRDADGVESPAYAIENQLRSQPQVASTAPAGFGPPGFAPAPPPMPPMIPVRFCRTPAGTCQIQPALVPIGTGCYCATPTGQQFQGQAF